MLATLYGYPVTTIRDPEATRRRIIEVTQRLFAEGGEEATSLRAVTRAAGVNVAAVQYHFSGRDGLLRVVVDQLVEPINERRLALLDQAQGRYGDVVPVAELLAAFLRPDLEVLAQLRQDRVPLARFLGRAYTQPSPTVAGFADDEFRPIAERLMPLLAAALPQVGPAELEVRVRLVVAIVTSLFATAAPAGEPGPLGTDDVEEQLQILLAFCGPAVSAPPTRE